MRTKILRIMLFLALFAIRANSQSITIDSLTITNATKCDSCNGEAVAYVTGAYPPFVYYWSNNYSNHTRYDNGVCPGSYYLLVYDSHGDTASAIFNIGPPSVSLTTSSSNSACASNSGTATAIPSGGVTPYTYLWSPGGQTTAHITGLSAGTYFVTIHDAHGCYDVDSAVVYNLSTLNDSILTTNTACGGNTGTATALASGGISPYTYLWSPGGQTTAHITGLSAGTYTVNITDSHGCNVVSTVNIYSLSGLYDSLYTTNASCGNNNGTATANVFGGTAPYTYLWSPGGQTTASISGLSSGTYSLTVTDAHGCTFSDVAYVGISGLNVSISSTNVNCSSPNSGSATASASGGTAPYTYSWSPGGQTTASISGLSMGSYRVYVRDAHGCGGFDSVMISISFTLYDSVRTVNTTCGSTGSATANVSGGVAPYTYLWAPGGQTTATITGLAAGNYTVSVTDAGGCNVINAITIYSLSTLYDSVTTTNSTCSSNNGTASANVFGGNAPYTYLWSPGGQTTATVTGLSGGTYSVTVTDAHGCTYSNAIYIGVTGLNVSVTETNVLCSSPNSGTATANASGGVGPYTYLWTPSGQTTAMATGLSAGFYSVYVTDSHGCNGSDSVYVGSWTPLYDSASYITGSSCSSNNGSAYVMVFGGSHPYTYLWSPSGETTATATGLGAGSYTVTVTDLGGCTITTSVIVPSIGPVPTIVTGPDSCNGGSDGFASVTSVSGGIIPYTYSWAPTGSTTSSISGLTAGNYTVTIIDNTGCSSTTAVNIYQPAPLAFVADTVADTGSCSGSAYIRVSGGTMPYTYTWSAPVNMFADSLGEYTDSLCAGAYLVCITDAHGCSNCDSIHIRHAPHPLGIGSIKEDISGIKVYPDPTSSVLNVATDQLGSGSYNLYVYDMIGRQVLQNNNITINRGETISVNVSNLPTGKYMLRISGTSSNKIAPFIVTH